MGVAPLLLAAKHYHHADIYLGFNHQSFEVESFEQIHITQAQYHRITDIIDPTLYSVIMACGPVGMLQALAEKIKAVHAPTLLYVSTEKRMACGIGACLTCSIQTTHGNRRVCKESGIQFGVDTEVARQIVREVRQVTHIPLMVKLSPNTQDIVAMMYMCEQEGTDAVSLVNTFSAMKINIHQRRSAFHNMYAGLSGPAIKPIALRMVHQVSHAVSIPVVGMGVICSVEDMIEYIMAGAEAVQIGTYNFVNLHAGEELVTGLTAWMEKEKVQ